MILMKQDFNDPMDSLLSDYARRLAARAPSAGANRVPEGRALDHNNMEHPDADEMAAFAENALPAAARARTVAHLADCGVCRQSVIALMRVESVASETAKSIPPQSLHTRPSWRERFAAFFASPAALRYAVPTLAAVLFAALIAGIMFNRRQPEATLVASRQEPQTSAVAHTDPASNDTESAMNSNTTASSAGKMSGSVSMSNTATIATTTTTTTTTTATANTATPTRRAANTNSSNAKEAPAASASNSNNSSGNTPFAARIPQQPATSERQNFDDEAIRVTNRSRAAARPSAAPPAAANMSGSSTGVAAGQSEQVAVTSSHVAKASKSNAGSNNSDAAQNSDSPSFSTEARAASRRRAPPTTPTAKNDLSVNGRVVNKAKASAAPSALRRVNGRDFRRQGTRWLDAAYLPSQSTTNIRRGSKQYRTVVSAEPGIGQIAAQLDGEVIVVWKGRAYRIH